MRIAGMVTPRPNAIDSPADPAVCTMLFSRMVASRRPSFDNTRKSVMAITATGIEALTVNPTFSTRYSEDAPKMIPSTVPITMGITVISRRLAPGGMYGRNAARNGLSGLKPIRSGYSCAAAASLGLMISVDIRS